jgi:hypothetical protein
MFEKLAWDKNKRPSSKSRIKSGPNRGYHHPERGGEWIYISGACYEEGSRRSHNMAWIKRLEPFGLRFGVTDMDGVESVWVWRENGKE